MLVKVYIQFRQFENAIKALDRLKDLAKDINDYNLLAEIYNKIAQCHIKLNRNNYALSCYQTMLQYAWLNKD